MSSKEFQDFVDKENLELDSINLRRLLRSQSKSSEIDDFVCDIVDKLSRAGVIHTYESVDMAYYVANAIKRRFII